MESNFDNKMAKEQTQVISIEMEQNNVLKHVSQQTTSSAAAMLGNGTMLTAFQPQQKQPSNLRAEP